MLERQPSSYIVRCEGISPRERRGIEEGIEQESLVSFVIPTLNSARTLGPCLSSIESQSYKNVEIIIVDGYSQDQSLEIAESFNSQILQSYGSLGQAREEGIEYANGEIILE